MSGISSKSENTLANKYKYNGGNELQANEFNDGSGLDLYDAHFRFYDAQIGRFHQIDAFAGITLSISTYAFSNNNPVSNNDPLGLTPTDPNEKNEAGNKISVQQLDEVVVSNKSKKQSSSAGLRFTNGFFKALDKYTPEQRRIDEYQNDQYLKKNYAKVDPMHMKMYDLRAQANREWKQNSIGALVALASPVLIMGCLQSGVISPTVQAIKWTFQKKAQTSLVGGLADLAVQYGTNGNNLSDINVVSTAANILTGNPFLSAFTGATINLSWNTSLESIQTGSFMPFMPRSAGDWLLNTGTNTIGNHIGNYLGPAMSSDFGHIGSFLGNSFGNIFGTSSYNILK